jgi:ubiquinone/menaquinone biosynthesis C-methylase UbiE
MDEFDQTIRIYDQVADEFVARHQRTGWWDNPGTDFDRFIKLLAPGMTVLDIGCGPGSDTAHFRRAGFRTFGLDRSTGMLAQARQYFGHGFGQADMRHLPLACTCLDVVWMQASLLHLPRADAPRALAEAHRVLRPHGLFYLSVKQGEGEGYLSNLAGQPRYFVFHQPDAIQQLLAEAGFAVVEQWSHESPQVTWLVTIARKSAD